MMSRIAPRVQRTSFVSAAGGILEVHAAQRAPVALKATFACAMTGLSPWLVELVLAEVAREEATVVLAPLEVDNKRPAQCVSVNSIASADHG